jgi:glycosyltransferase involved in cell wall biosynthesis
VVDGETGYLAPVGDVALMTDRAISVLRDPARLEELRRGAVARAGLFAADKVVPQYERVYEDVLRD